MNSILRRRRAAIVAKNETSDLVYELNNYIVSTGDYIETDVPFFKSDFSGTILLDIDIQVNQTGNTSPSRVYRLICISKNSLDGEVFFIGKGARAATEIIARNVTAASTNLGVEVGIARYKFAVTHEASSKKVYVWANKDASAPAASEVNYTNYVASDQFITFGRDSDGCYLPQSVIYDARVYNRILSNAEINAFFA